MEVTGPSWISSGILSQSTHAFTAYEVSGISLVVNYCSYSQTEL